MRIRSLGEEVSLGYHVQRRDESVAYCVMELYNLWYTFSRSLYLSSAFRAKQSTGSRVVIDTSLSVTSYTDALTVAIHAIKPNLASRAGPWSWFDEPAWDTPKVLLSALDALGASNYAQVSAALSLRTRTSIPSHFKKFRNFYGHRSEDARLDIRGTLSSYSIPWQLHASECLMRPATSRGNTRPQVLLLDFIDDVGNVMSLMI